MLAPMRFEPFVRPMVWGGRTLGDVLGKTLPTEAAYGESWDLSDHSLHRSVVVAGSERGRSLRELMEQERTALLGAAAPAFTQFPWLVKFLDACDWLSVQVHPDEAAVRKLWPGEGSKTEAWFVLEARPGSRIYAGLKPGVDAERFREATAAGTVVECLHSFEPRAGDCVFLPAGTVHAVGGGVLLAEVQQTSDATFRVFDWNRRDAQGKTRTLHVAEALACIDWSRGPVQPIHVAAFARPDVTEHLPLVRCPYFHLDYVQGSEPLTCGGTGSVQVMVVLRGRGRWQGGAGEEVSRGQVWLLPASMPGASLQPDASLEMLLCGMP